jgi:hypothetical protein
MGALFQDRLANWTVGRNITFDFDFKIFSVWVLVLYNGGVECVW